MGNNYPSAYFPTKFGTSNTSLSNPSLQIAYGRNTESNVAKISAYVTMNGSNGTYICSATPVKYEAGITFLVGAAHCFMQNKNNSNTVESTNLYAESEITVYYGASDPFLANYTNAKVYVRKDYCLKGTFTTGYDCPNFSPSDGVSGGQGNDIAVIQISGEFGGNDNHYFYPHVVESNEYPQAYTMAPVLSIGYGINTQSPYSAGCVTGNCGYMYYVAGYQYETSVDPGYHYLYNSFFNGTLSGNGYSYGYSDLICGGDSGGSDLFWTGSKWILLSEHTYGPSNSCGKFYKSLPNAATNVSAYYDWIQSIINAGANAKTQCQNSTIENCVTNN